MDALAHHSDDTKSPGWFATFHAPVTFFIRPRGPLQHVLHGPCSAVVLAYMLSIVVFISTLISVIVCTNSLTNEAARAGRTALAASFASFFSWPRSEMFVVFVFGVSVGIVLGTCAWALFMTPDLHRAGPCRFALWRALRLAACLPWLLTVFAIGTGCVTVAIQYSSLATGVLEGTDPPAVAVGVFPSILLSALLLIALSVRAVRLAAETIPEPEGRSPVCEGCGYDLSHLSEGGACAECGLTLAKSLEQDAVRPGSQWEARRTLGSWLVTSVAVLFSPARFYRAVKLRTAAEATAKFARVHFALMGLGGGLWIICIFLSAIRGPGPMSRSEYFLVAFVTTLWTLGVPALAWILHRAVHVLSTAHWLLLHEIPDARWSCNVRNYEAGFAWVFCAFNGTLLSLLMLRPTWFRAITEWYRSMNLRILGLAWEETIVLFGNAALIIGWFFRYRGILRVIRWSNS